MKDGLAASNISIRMEACNVKWVRAEARTHLKTGRQCLDSRATRSDRSVGDLHTMQSHHP